MNVKTCHLCRASRTIARLNFADLRDTARHRRTLYTRSQYMAWTLPQQRSPICKHPGWHLWRVFFDAMHCLDQGVLPLHNGSTLWYLLLTQQVWRSATRQGRCLEAHAEYSQFCKDNGITDIADSFDEQHIKTDSNAFPCLSHLKASEQRWLVYWIHSKLLTLPADPIQQLITASYGGLIQMDVVCRRNGRFLPDAEKDLLYDASKCSMSATMHWH